MADSATLELIRKIALAFPEAVENESFGSPWFRARGKPFAIYGTDQGRPTLSIKASRQDQGIYLRDERFFKTPYIGQHGWVTLILDEGATNRDEIEGLIGMSYENNVPRRKAGKR